jgi:hypothetical protein
MSAYLNNFTSPFFPAPAFYTGSGATTLVPNVFPVAINGRPYLVDLKAGSFRRQYDVRVRDSVDQSNEPGEAAINPQGLWRRSQSSWHYGAGQAYGDTADAEAFRFNTSKGVEVWNKGQATLLKDTTQVLADSAATLQALTVGTRLYVATGGDVKHTTDLSTFTNCTSEPGGNVGGMATDGFNVFVAFAANGIYKVTTSSDAFASHITGTDTFVNLRYVKGRLMASEDNDVYNFTGSGVPGSPLFTHSNTGFRWVGFAGGQNHIYMGGFAGNQSLIYRTTIKADASSLDTPIVALELPAGEIITGLDSYLNYVLIGTTKGIRVATSDTDGNLVAGALINIGSSVTSFTGEGRFVWFNYTNFDATSTGLGRLDLSVFIASNQPAYASDLMVTAQGVVSSVNTINSRPVFVVVGSGIYVEHATDLVPTGYLESGIYRWGVPDAKFIPKWDIRCRPLNGSVTLSIKSDGGSYHDFQAFTLPLGKEKTFTGLEDRVFETEAKITIGRSATNNTACPELTRWMGRAYAAPLRSQIFSVPLIMHHKLSIRGREYFQDVDNEMTFLRDLVDTPRIVTYQENEEAYSVIVENVQFEVLDDSSIHNRWDWEGTATVIMRSVA